MLTDKRFGLARLCAGAVISASVLLAGGMAAADQGAYPQSDAEKQAAYNALTWQRELKSYPLPDSHAQFQLPSGNVLLLGADAERFAWLVSGVEFPATEAILSPDSEDNSLVYFEWRDEGYVSDSDWEEVDAAALLKEYSESTEHSNEERAKNGFAPMHVVGWLQPPEYNPETHTVSYALELEDGEGHWANAVALRLGRAGYVEMTWAGSLESLKQDANKPALLQTALGAHEFDAGHRYADFQDGDKVAAYGIGGLLATALGLKFGKGLLAALLAFIVAGKKILIPAALFGVAALAKYGRKLFGGRPQS